jgi:hypothetical protein
LAEGFVRGLNVCKFEVSKGSSRAFYSFGINLPGVTTPSQMLIPSYTILVAPIAIGVDPSCQAETNCGGPGFRGSGLVRWSGSRNNISTVNHAVVVWCCPFLNKVLTDEGIKIDLINFTSLALLSTKQMTRALNRR